MTYRTKIFPVGIAAFAIFSSVSVSAAEIDPETGMNEFLREYERVQIAVSPTFDQLPEPSFRMTVNGCVITIKMKVWHPSEAVFFEMLFKSIAALEEPPEDILEELNDKIEGLREDPVPVLMAGEQRLDLARLDFNGGQALPAQKGFVGRMLLWPDVNRADTPTNRRVVEILKNYAGSPERVEKMKRDGQRARLKFSVPIYFSNRQETDRQREDRLREWDYKRYVFVKATRQMLALDDMTDIAVTTTYRGEEPFGDDDIIMGKFIQPDAFPLVSEDEAGLNLQVEQLVAYKNHTCPDAAD